MQERFGVLARANVIETFFDIKVAVFVPIEVLSIKFINT
jgi:hypothetical protein